MPKSAIGGAQAHKIWGKDADPSITAGLEWSEVDIYSIAAGSLTSAAEQLRGAGLADRSPHDLERAYDHMRRLVYRGMRDFIETTLHPGLLAGGPRLDANDEPSSSGANAEEMEYAKPEGQANGTPATDSQTLTFDDLIKEDWRDCVAPNSLYASDSPAAYTAALFAEIKRIDLAQGALDTRRPDIGKTSISRDSIEHGSHELERVIRILEGPDSDQSDAALATAYFPWNLPFIESFTTLKAALDCQGTSLGDLLFDARQAFQLSNGDAQNADSLRQLWFAYLGIAKVEREILTGPAWEAGTDTKKYFGCLVSSPGTDGPNFKLDQEALCGMLGLDESEIDVLLTAMNLKGGGRKDGLTACAWFAEQATLDPDAGISCGIDFLDRLHRFIRLYRWLKLELADLVALLNTVIVNAPVRSSSLTDDQIQHIGLFCMLRSRYQLQVEDFSVLVRPATSQGGTASKSRGQLSAAERALLQTRYAVSGQDIDAALRSMQIREINLAEIELPDAIARLKLLSRIAQIRFDELDYLLTAMGAFTEVPVKPSRGPDTVAATSIFADNAGNEQDRGTSDAQAESSSSVRRSILDFCVLAEWRRLNQISCIKLNDVVVLYRKYVGENISLNLLRTIAGLGQGSVSEPDSLTCLARVMSSECGISFDSARSSLRQLGASGIVTLASRANAVLERLKLPVEGDLSSDDNSKFERAVSDKNGSTAGDLKYIFATLVQDAFIASCMSISNTEIQEIEAIGSVTNMSKSAASRDTSSKRVGSKEPIMLNGSRVDLSILGAASMRENILNAYNLNRSDIAGIRAVIAEKAKLVKDFADFKEWAGKCQAASGKQSNPSDLQWAHCYMRLQQLSAQYHLPENLLASIVAAAPDYPDSSAQEICSTLRQVFDGSG